MSEPPITLRAAHDSGPGNTPIMRIVIHATCPDVGYAAASAPDAAHGTALYFQTQAAGGSAHYVCGVAGEEHCVPEAVIAWHAPPNPHSLGIEITAEGGDYAGSYSREQWLSPQVWPAVRRAAARARDLCQRYGVPTVRLTPADLLAGRRGICGHVDVSQAWHQTDHTDPGPDFPWPEFMAAVNDAPAGPTVTTLGDDDVRVLIDNKGGIHLDSGYEVQSTGDPGLAGIWQRLYGQPVPVTQGEVGTIAADDAARRVRLLAGVTASPVDAAALAAAIPADLAQQVADELGKRLAAPTPQ